VTCLVFVASAMSFRSIRASHRNTVDRVLDLASRCALGRDSRDCEAFRTAPLIRQTTHHVDTNSGRYMWKYNFLSNFPRLRGEKNVPTFKVQTLNVSFQVLYVEASIA
jgi:hypothetical protein